MIAKVLMIFSASIILILGILHLVYTFWGPKLTPRDAALQLSMSQISPVITKETTMWRAWVGFNASHSMGAILFGLIYGYLAIAQSQLLFHSPFLLIVGLAMLGGFFCARESLLVQRSVHWHQHFIGLLCGEHRSVAGLTGRSATKHFAVSQRTKWDTRR